MPLWGALTACAPRRAIHSAMMAAPDSVKTAQLRQFGIRAGRIGYTIQLS